MRARFDPEVVERLLRIAWWEWPEQRIVANGEWFLRPVSEFLQHFDGFSIGSNDMTQMTLAVDRDAGGAIAATFDERDDAVKAMLAMAITACRKAGKYAGICGQGPSDYPELAQWLVEQHIESISLNPDTVVDTWLTLAKNNHA